MATKIDLLPGYVKWTKRFRYTIAAAIVGLCLWTGGLILVYHSKTLELLTAQENANAATEVATEANSAAANAATATGAAGSYQAANDFFLASCKSGSKRAALINLVRNYIDLDSVVKSIDISDGAKVVIVATVKTPDEYAQFLYQLRGATGVLFVASPPPRLTTTGVGGYGNGAQTLVVPQPDAGSPPVIVNYPITLQAEGTLLYPLGVPPDPTGGAAGAAAPGAGPGGGLTLSASPGRP